MPIRQSSEGSRHPDMVNVMRVSIYTAYLSDKRGFKRIAKKLQKNWPSGTPMSLASDQAILSRGLGYRDFHDIQQSAETTGSKAHKPTQNDIGIVSGRRGVPFPALRACHISILGNGMPAYMTIDLNHLSIR